VLRRTGEGVLAHRADKPTPAGTAGSRRLRPVCPGSPRCRRAWYSHSSPLPSTNGMAPAVATASVHRRGQRAKRAPRWRHTTGVPRITLGARIDTSRWETRRSGRNSWALRRNRWTSPSSRTFIPSSSRGTETLTAGHPRSGDRSGTKTGVCHGARRNFTASERRRCGRCCESPACGVTWPWDSMAARTCVCAVAIVFKIGPFAIGASARCSASCGRRPGGWARRQVRSREHGFGQPQTAGARQLVCGRSDLQPATPNRLSNWRLLGPHKKKLTTAPAGR